MSKLVWPCALCEKEIPEIQLHHNRRYCVTCGDIVFRARRRALYERRQKKIKLCSVCGERLPLFKKKFCCVKCRRFIHNQKRVLKRRENVQVS